MQSPCLCMYRSSVPSMLSRPTYPINECQLSPTCGTCYYYLLFILQPLRTRKTMFGFRRPVKVAWDDDSVENELPVEMWVEIFNYLEPQDEVSIEATCHLFYDIIKSRKDDKLDHFIEERKKMQKKAWKRKKREERLAHLQRQRERRECCEKVMAIPCGCLCGTLWCCGKVWLQWLSVYIFCPCMLLGAPFICWSEVCDSGFCDGCNSVADVMWTICNSSYPTCGLCKNKESDDMCPCVPWCEERTHSYC